LARGCLYDLALTDVETRDAIIAMVRDLLIGSAVTARSLTGLLWRYAYPTISAVGIERRGKHPSGQKEPVRPAKVRPVSSCVCSRF
jgi:hypothetical protein